MPKFYAVRQGRNVGIFNTWDECKKQVMGFSGAEYKSFTSIEDAKAFMGLEKKEISLDENAVTAYVDGSYNVKTGEYSYGAVIFHNGEEHTFSEKFDDPEAAKMRNVAGEINGAMRAMRYCAENNEKVLNIFYDYEGIEKWCTGVWKTNKPGTIAYKKYYDEIKEKVRVVFYKVKGHSGDKYNDMADRLAKEALGI